MKSRYLFSSLFLFFLFSCNNNKNKFDASGIFEADPSSQSSAEACGLVDVRRGSRHIYVNYKKPSHATDSEMTDDDVIVRYAGEEVIGYTVLHASKRAKESA